MALTGSRAAEALVGYRGNAPAPGPQAKPHAPFSNPPDSRNSRASRKGKAVRSLPRIPTKGATPHHPLRRNLPLCPMEYRLIRGAAGDGRPMVAPTACRKVNLFQSSQALTAVPKREPLGSLTNCAAAPGRKTLCSTGLCLCHPDQRHRPGILSEVRIHIAEGDQGPQQS